MISGLEIRAFLFDHQAMSAFIKQISFIVILALLSNGVSAVQMKTMMSTAEQAAVQVIADQELPCHGEETASSQADSHQVSNCCKSDCIGCIISTQAIYLQRFDFSAPPPTTESSLAIDKQLLTEHRSPLFRPPILN